VGNLYDDEGGAMPQTALELRVNFIAERAQKLDRQINGFDSANGISTRTALLERDVATFMAEVLEIKQEVQHLRYSAYAVVASVVIAALCIILFGGSPA
jgi:hypothetical protein